MDRFQESLDTQLAPYRAYLSGPALVDASTVLLIKGKAGLSEQAGGLPFSGEDGLALDKALSALGWPVHAWCGVLLAPERTTDDFDGSAAPPLDSGSLRLICEILDPLVVIALDEGARQALLAAFSSEESGSPLDFPVGMQRMVLGRNFVSVDEFEAALNDPEAKQRVWAQLKRAAPRVSLV